MLKSSGIKTGRRKLGRIYARLAQRRLRRVQNNMAAKKSMKESRGRKWSEDELKEFASVLADDWTEFALTLETLEPKRSANVHIFEAIKKELVARLQAKTTTSSKKGKAKEINTLVKLQAKYKWLKEQWRKNLLTFRGLEVHFWPRFNSCPVSSESRA